MSQSRQLKYLAIGDSYTVGTSVSSEKSFPFQLKDMIEKSYAKTKVEVDIIAKNGWTSEDLLAATDHLRRPLSYDFATLLIGVNNQYDGVPFDLFIAEFELLVQRALKAVQGRKDRAVIISLPDYAYTPYGQAKADPSVISNEVRQYNNHIQTTCDLMGLTFISLVALSKEWDSDKSLVASDGLHLSGNAYKRIAKKILDQLKLTS